MTQDLALLIRQEIECPKCHKAWAWLGDQGQSVVVNGRCLTCILFEERHTEEEADELVDKASKAREHHEDLTGRRVLPCPACMLSVTDECGRCKGHRWVLGYPPGYGHLSPSG